MDGPVISGAEMIRIIDENGGMHWCIDGIVRFLRPPGDGSLLQLGARLIRISSSRNRAPSHLTVASPPFLQHGSWSVVLEPDTQRNLYELPGLKPYNHECRAVNIHLICQSYLGKVFAPNKDTRFLLSS